MKKKLRLITGEEIAITPEPKICYPQFTCPFCKKTSPPDWCSESRLKVIMADGTIKEIVSKYTECCCTEYIEEEKR